ncbi:hypothetical protein BU23DRAFT_561137 [Bimuria novae-zelandiae CBS 107.79]|uniref:Cytochrome b561 domain-containing protein n=1 Tax=Bimuria novae-zelandiae CBS 107.79 TaxID=1447943 RepID=A0A6A5UR64_9PLEO|nr:hypothetical protein BU23DRAFT_561137 [Bimuria novae-zelandiae CBS 107.79]
MGAENGLNLTTPEESKAIATKAAAAMGQEPTGILAVAQYLGSGIGAQLAPAFGNGTSDLLVGMAAYALAQGIGQASASGLNLTQEQFQPTNNSDVMSIARNFGLGVTVPIARSLGAQMRLNQVSGTSDFMAQIPQIAAAAGEGLGQGASKGLGLSRSETTGALAKRQATDATQMDIPGIVGNFTRGLSQSFLESSNLGMLLSGGAGGFSLDSSSLVSLASGAGKGIGEGISVGLGASPGNGSMALETTTGENQAAELIAEQFTKNLVASLFQNGGIKAIGDTLTSQAGGLTTNVDMAKVAEGAARGLVEGSVSAFSEAGGFQKVISGDFPKELATNLAALPQTKFNDSLNGSVVAFTRGLSGEGVLLISQMFNMGKNSSSPLPAKRSVDANGGEPFRQMSRRADMVTPAIDDLTLQGIAQSGLDTVTCSGFGGLAALALGIMQGPLMKNAGMMDMPTLAPLDDSTLAALSKGPVTIMNEGNKFTVDIVKQAVTINGLEIKPFAITTALHVLFSVLAFFFALPAYLALGAIWRLSDMIGQPINDAKVKKWRMIVLLGLFTPFALIGVIFGIVGKGSAAHFNTAHGIFGLIALLVLVPAVILSFMRLRTAVAIPPPSAFLFKNQLAAMKGPHKVHVIANTLVQQTLAFGMISFTQGFSDLRAISLCVVDAILTAPTIVGLLNLVLFISIATNGLLIARFILERRLAQSSRAEHGDVVLTEKAGRPNMNRSATMKTFGFDSTPVPAIPRRPTLAERRTADLLGRADSQIGFPTDARKFGEQDPQDPHPGIRILSNPFVHPEEQLVSPRVYNAKLGGFEDECSPAFPLPKLDTNFDNNYAPSNGLRPSSELDPQSRYVSYAPPSRQQYPERDIIGTPEPTVRRLESFSRPMKAPKSPTHTELGWDRDLALDRDEMPKTNPYAYVVGGRI